MARRWGNGPIDVKVGRGGSPNIKLPSFSQLRLILLGIAVLALLWTGYYQIQPEEVGVIQRFGRYVRTTPPGPHLKLPFGIETLTRVPVQRQLKMEFGFRTADAGVRSQYVGGGDLEAEAVMLTGDLNVGVVEWIVQYRISDPYAWLFNVRSPVETFRYTSEAAMRQVVGDHSVDEVITTGREDIARQARDELQRLCQLYGLGIEVQQLVLQNVNPPDPVKPAFNEVNQAIQEKERSINEAWAEYNQAVPRAQGEAEQMIRAAEGYALERVNRAQGDASRFDAVYAEFRKSPDVTRRRLYLEAMGRLLPRLGRKVILDENARGVLPLLQLDGPRREVQQ
jgi:membrane protease subunit HflK